MKVGFIGLGIMGRPMAKNVIKGGYEVTVFDFNKEAVADLVSCGAKAAESGKELAAEVDVVITMVPNSPHVRAAVLGADGGELPSAATDILIKKSAASCRMRLLFSSGARSFLQFPNPAEPS